jgi:hypothetical protein
MADYYNASSEDEYERLNRTVVPLLAAPIAALEQNADGLA